MVYSIFQHILFYRQNRLGEIERVLFKNVSDLAGGGVGVGEGLSVGKDTIEYKLTLLPQYINSKASDNGLL